MQITTITYGRTVNKGDYNSERLEMTGALEEGESHEEALTQLKSAVVKGLNMSLPAPVKEEKPAKKTTKKTAKKASKKVEKKAEVKEEVEEEVKEEEVITLADIKAKLKEVAINKGKNVAIEIVRSFGADKSDGINENDYSRVVKQIEKALK